MTSRQILCGTWCLVVLLVSGCDQAFLHDVAARQGTTEAVGCTPPNGPLTGIDAAVAAQRVRLTWTTEATDESGFLLERRSEGEDTWGELIRLAGGTYEFSDYEIDPDTEYSYRVTAYKVERSQRCDGEEMPEATVLTYPLPFTALSATTAGAGAIDLAWTDPNRLGRVHARVERRSAGGTYDTLAETSAGETSHADTGLDPGTTYEYRVFAINGTGEAAPLEASERTSYEPELAWTTSPELGLGCALSVGAEASFDDEKGAVFLSASATVDMGPAPPDAQADVTGFSAVLGEAAAGSFGTTWSVEDSLGGQASLERDLLLSVETVVRTPARAPTRTEGDGAVDGQQALLPVCASCTGTRGQLVAGGAHSCLLTGGGRVLCWGDNTHGQLGTGVPPRSLTAIGSCQGGSDGPCQAPLTGVLDLDLGDGFACAVTADNEVRCWGSNYRGKLGDGSDADRGVPSSVCAPGPVGEPCAALRGVTAVATGGEHACALVGPNHQVHCWGNNYRGQLGVGSGEIGDTWRPLPVCASGTGDGCPGLEDVAAIAAGGEHTCVLTEAGAVLCWGYDWSGQVGNGDEYDDVHNPVSPCLEDGTGTGCADLPTITGLAAGGEHTCAVTDTGGVLCWGDSYDGQCGLGETASEVVRATPVCATGSVSGGDCVALDGVDEVACGLLHTCARRGDRVVCWGKRDNGRSGDGDETNGDQLNPTPVCATGSVSGGDCVELTGVLGLELGHEYSCARLDTGELHCWGRNYDGQLGTGESGNNAHHLNPTPVCAGPAVAPDPCPPLTDVTLAAGADDHGCAVAGDAVVCWGGNDAGRLGVGNPREAVNPVEPCAAGFGLTCEPLVGVASLAAGNNHTCAVMASGRVKCWGISRGGRTGHGEPCEGTGYCPQRNPVDVCAPGEEFPCTAWLEDAVAVSCGRDHTCAVRGNGELACWGDNACGQLGNGDMGTCADYEELPQLVPVPVCDVGTSGEDCPRLQDAIAVDVGYYDACALTAAGQVACWGYNSLGQLGDGTWNNIRGTPEWVCAEGGGPGCPPLDGVVAVSVGGYHSCALLADATLRCWGLNHCGQLGNGFAGLCTPDDTFNEELPATVCASGFGSTCPRLEAASISAGEVHTCALALDGTAYCWGLGWAGPLGTGDQADQSNPARVCLTEEEGCQSTCTEEATDFISLSASWGHTCALTAAGTAKCWGMGDNARLGNGLEYHSIESHRCSPVDVCATGSGDGCLDGAILDDAALMTCDVRSVSVPARSGGGR